MHNFRFMLDKQNHDEPVSSTNLLCRTFQLPWLKNCVNISQKKQIMFSNITGKGYHHQLELFPIQACTQAGCRISIREPWRAQMLVCTSREYSGGCKENPIKLKKMARRYKENQGSFLTNAQNMVQMRHKHHFFFFTRMCISSSRTAVYSKPTILI